MDVVGDPPLWGDWRANADPDFYVSWCPGCAAEMWISRISGDRWRVVCMNDVRTCTPAEIEAGHQALLAAQRERYRAEREARGSLEPTDPFNGIEAEVYIELLTGQEPRHHFFRCPFHSNSDERTPSLHATGVFWYCHGCHLGGTIYDFGAHLWDITPRGEGFKDIQQRLAQGLRRGVPT